jgi:hypothetical protein
VGDNSAKDSKRKIVARPRIQRPLSGCYKIDREIKQSVKKKPKEIYVMRRKLYVLGIGLSLENPDLCYVLAIE